MNGLTTTDELLAPQGQLACELQPFKNSVQQALQNYFTKLGDDFSNNVYEMVLSEVEAPLLDIVMKYTKGNQSKAAILLGLSRGTLRKKLKIYGFID